MAPQSSQSSAPSPSLKRKQPSISSFFTQKPTPSASPKNPEATPAKGPKKRQASPAEKINESKRADPVEEDEDEDIVVPAPKRAKTAGAEAEEPIRVATSVPFEHTSQPSSSQRTDIFKFQSSPAAATGGPATDATEEVDPEQKMRKKEKEKLHQKFVKKLGGADCLIGIGRTVATDSAAGTDEAAEAEDDDEPPPPPTKGKGAKKGGKLTPMEKQVVEIKRKHMNTVLVIEVGYKFRFFGEDARIAAKELGIVCIPGKFRFDERKCISTKAD
jgi:DNA mismatch repair protein MSH3